MSAAPSPSPAFPAQDVASSSSAATITPVTHAAQMGTNKAASPPVVPALSAIPASRVIPADMVRLDVLLTTGQRAFYDFKPTDTVSDAKRKVWTNWPLDWPARPSSWSSLRLLHLGTFLDDRVVLGQDTSADGQQKQGPSSSLSSTSPSSASKTKQKAADANSSLAANKDATARRNFPVGTRTVIHLVLRTSTDGDVDEDADQDDDDKKDTNSGAAAKGAAAGSRRNGRRGGDHDGAGGGGNDAGCCCVIC